MQVRTLLFPAEHSDLIIVDGVVGQNIDREIKALTRTIAADRGGPNSHANKTLRLVFEEQRLTQTFELVIEREGHKRVLLCHSWRFGIAIYRGGGGINKPLDPLLFSSHHHRLETPVINFFAELLIQLEACIIGNTRQVDHRIDTPALIPQFSGIADIPSDNLEAWVRFYFAPVIHDVVDRHIVAGRQQLWGQERADVAGASSNQNILYHRDS